MWLVLTITFAIASYLAVVWFESLVPALLLLLGSLMFAAATWKNRSGRR